MPTRPDSEPLIDAYRRMKTIREFEERLHVEIATGEIPGFTHLYAGQEAVAVGVCAHLDDRDYMVAAFERHTAEVRRTIPKDRLLVFEVAQGWKPLCEFLDVPIPSVPFPRLNARAEIAAMLAAAGAQGPAAPEDIAAHAKEFIAQSRKR